MSSCNEQELPCSLPTTAQSGAKPAVKLVPGLPLRCPNHHG